ncbi:MAG TPA: DUF5317 family protein [Actinomycetota bacterium]|nr:DUF5317 family protein [Actinomycetota bacterium]
MLYLAGIALGLLAGFAMRGRLRWLAASVRFPWVWLLYVAVLAQVGAGFVSASWLTRDVKFWIVIGSYGLLIVWLGVVAAAHRAWLRVAFLIVGAGTALNLVAIAPNRGIPVSRAALRAANAPIPSGEENRFALKHVFASDTTVLNWLGDVIPVRPIRDVISIGDIVIGLGIAWVIAAGMRARPREDSPAGDEASGQGAGVMPPAPGMADILNLRSRRLAPGMAELLGLRSGRLAPDTTVADFLGRFARDYAVGHAYDPMSEQSRHPSESRVSLSQAMSITDANLAGNVHGGVIMKLVDTAAGLSAIKHAHGRVVTVSMDEMSFIEPVFLTDVVTLTAQVNDVGRTSMEVGVRVEAENTVTGERRHVSSAYLVFVALDEEGKPRPVPRLDPETDEERRRQDEAKIRRRHRIASKEAVLARRQAQERGETPPPPPDPASAPGGIVPPGDIVPPGA